MLINWFTVGAQALNFLILVGLLKHFLYKPILTAIDTRETRIAGDLADAAAKKIEAQKERDDFQRKNEELDQQRAGLLGKAKDEAKAERARLIGDAQQAADAMSTKRGEALKKDAQNLNQAISRCVQQEVFAVARKALTDLATTSLEERVGAVFTRRLRTLDSKTKADLAEAIRSASAPALVRSAFELPGEQRAVIQNALNETFSAEVQLRFEVAPDLVSGIELTSNGRKLGWSIAGYLSSLENAVSELVKECEKPEPKAEPKAEPKPEGKAESEPEPEPEPDAAKPEPDAAKPEPDAAKPEPDAAKPEPDAAKPEPDAAKPEASAHERSA